jgi:hypothetical protein
MFRSFIIATVVSCILGSIFHTPSGAYKGTTKELGETITGEVTIKTNNTFNIIVHGSGIAKVGISCMSQTYKLAANGTVSLPNVATKGNCLHDALESSTVKLKKITYDSDKNTVSIFVHKFVDIAIVAEHESMAVVVDRNKHKQCLELLENGLLRWH